ncbi:aspartate/glutamate racemase family protein, partial [Xenorhabdus bovienii]|uniref:aspartate/glutamate racemase family protein n=1 Tax=Xenorhabdus bovienii TaxID=40576 RepID=UPI0023B225B3
CNKIVKEGINNVAILATTGTIKARLYQDRLEKENVRFLIPDDVQQHRVMESILAYKSGDGKRAYQLIESVIIQLKNVGVERFIMGCTEIPLILSGHGYQDEYIDATDELVKMAVAWSYLDNKL